MKVFIDPNLGLKFNHPALWDVKTQKKKTLITVPVGKDRRAATIELLDMTFFESTDQWQTYQREAVQGSGRTLDRQWQEDLMGVPLLLTQTRTRDRAGAERVSLTGLLYSRTNHKLFFRLATNPAVFPDVDAQWRTVMLSLATIDGEALLPEIPGRTPAAEPVKNPKANKPISVPLEQSPDRPRKTVVFSNDPNKLPAKRPRDTQAVETSAGGAQLWLFVPQAWTLEVEGDGFALRHPQWPSTITLEPLSVLDSAKPADKLTKMSGSTIGEFKTIDRREDRKPFTSSAGALVNVVTRLGSLESGAVVELLATGERGDTYWAVRSRVATAALTKEQQKLWESLLQGLLLEPRT